MDSFVTAEPRLYDSHLKNRLSLAIQRLQHYPLESLDFVMMDLERPALRTRHAHWCSYDLTGRVLLFYALAQGLDGTQIPRLPLLYERIMNNRRDSGAFGKAYGLEGGDPDTSDYIGGHFITGLVRYYQLTGDMRALSAAQESAGYLLKDDRYFASVEKPTQPNEMNCWLTEAFAELYRVTREDRYLEAVRRLAFHCVGKMQNAHAHGYLTTLRGIMCAAVYAHDRQLAEFVKARRQQLLDSGCITPIGDVSEAFPHSARNEGCAISDWVMLNLVYAQYYGEDEAYALAEHTLYNALYFNQFITGGFGHRYFSRTGYRCYIEEAWWCCTPNAGMCLAQVARNAVTLADGELRLNFLLPGEYRLPGENGEIRVDVTTGYPLKAQSIIRVWGTKQDIRIRVPDCIRQPESRRYEIPGGYEIHLDGKMGHHIEKVSGGSIVMYGPLVLAPMIYRWDTCPQEGMELTSVPVGYVHEDIRTGGYAINAGKSDADGFYPFVHGTVPVWSVFEEGEMAKISGGEAASAYIPVIFPDGEEKQLYFHPLCSATSNLTLMDTPVVFRSVQD